MAWRERIAVIAVMQPLVHLVVPFFLQCVALMLAWPAVADVTVAALCGPKEYTCGEALYLSGFIQGIVGVGTIFTSPYIGALSDDHGRKPLLVICFASSIGPYAILSWSTSRAALYTFYAARLVAGLVDGPLMTVILAYVGDVIPAEYRASAMGLTFSSFSVGVLVGTAWSRLLPAIYIFPVATMLLVASTLYAAFVIPESVWLPQRTDGDPGGASTATERTPLVGKDDRSAPGSGQRAVQPVPVNKLLRSQSTIRETLHAVRQSRSLSLLAAVSFFYNFSETGLLAVLLFYLKAVFHMSKDDFALLFFLIGALSLISQTAMLPMSVHFLGLHHTLSIGLLFCALHGILYGIAWAPWVVFVAASMAMATGFIIPSLSAIVSLTATEGNEGKFQGVVAGFRALASAIAPLIITPISVMFLGKDPPFNCPGAGQLFAGLFGVVAFCLGLWLPHLPQPPTTETSDDLEGLPPGPSSPSPLPRSPYGSGSFDSVMPEIPTEVAQAFH